MDFEQNNFSSANYLALKTDVDELKQRLECVEGKVGAVLIRQEEIAKMLTEQNALLRRSLGMGLINVPNRFPLASQEDLESIESELRSDKKLEIVGIMKHALSGSLNNLEGILMKPIISEFNLDGTKGKKALKDYPLLVAALFDAIKRDGYTHQDFLEEIRKIIRKLKNKYQKQNTRVKKFDKFKYYECN